ncbi:MAG: isoprenoid biosynthesis glyoxalase ElbB [Bacteroidales bacterium]
MEKKKRFAVILAGCGVFDGSEIHEATMTLYAIMKNRGEYEIFAPDIPQHHVIDHTSGDETDQTRNVLIESARIARGNIKALDDFRAEDFDAVIFPGGFGVAKNLSNFAFEGENCRVIPEVERVVNEMVKTGKPIGALCISPVLMAKILDKPELTIGEDKATINVLESMGAVHKKTSHGEVIVDPKYKLVTTPCYMLDANILHIADGANAVVKEIFNLF